PAGRPGRCWPGEPGLGGRPVRARESDRHPVPVGADPRPPPAPEPDLDLSRRRAGRGGEHDLVAACLKLAESGQPAGQLGGRVDDPDRPAAAIELARPDIPAAAALADERGCRGARPGLHGSAWSRTPPMLLSLVANFEPSLMLPARSFAMPFRRPAVPPRWRLAPPGFPGPSARGTISAPRPGTIPRPRTARRRW